MRNNEVRGPGLQKSTSERDWGLDLENRDLRVPAKMIGLDVKYEGSNMTNESNFILVHKHISSILYVFLSYKITHVYR